MKFYRGAARAARAYVERDRSRADDYHLDEGSGVAERFVATPDVVENAGAGAQRNKTFARKIDAERFLASVESAKVIGTYVDPALATVTVGEWAQRWLDGQAHLKPTTRSRYDGILRKHIHPKWDRVKLANVSHGDVQAWVTELARVTPLHGPEDPPRAQPGPRHGGQGRPARAQRRQRGEPAPGR